VPYAWRIGMIVLVVCLVASMVIAIVKLASTPEEIIGLGFRGLPPSYVEAHKHEYGGGEPAEP
jgi:hypothetical protein